VSRTLLDRVRGAVAPHPVSRLHPGLVAAVLVFAVGLGGLWVGATSEASAPVAAGQTTPSGPKAGDLTVSAAYVAQPTTPTLALAYLTVDNAGDQPDQLTSVYAGAARISMLHGSPDATQATGQLTVPARGTLRLYPGGPFIMLLGRLGTLRAGDRVSLQLTFQRSGQVLVEAPVVANGAANVPTPPSATGTS
jgi:periplasmic copper chaperone A